MTDINTVRASLTNAQNHAMAADFTIAQLAAYQALWEAVATLTDLVEGR